jgi:hypothetical protein
MISGGHHGPCNAYRFRHHAYHVLLAYSRCGNAQAQECKRYLRIEPSSRLDFSRLDNCFRVVVYEQHLITPTASGERDLERGRALWEEQGRAARRAPLCFLFIIYL